MTSCPNCGGPAAILDGTYGSDGERLIVERGSAFTRAAVDKLATVARAAQERKISAEELLAEVAEVSPELATKLKQYGFPAFALVMLLFWLWKSVSLNINVDVNKLIDQAWHVSQGMDPNSHEFPEPDYNKSAPDDPPTVPSPPPNWTQLGSGRNRAARRKAAARHRRQRK